MILKIGGTDITPYIAFGGVKWTRSDIDSPDTGRTMDGKMHRGRVATKIRLDITCRPLTTAEASLVLSKIYPEFVTVQYTDPMQGTAVTKTMYSNNNPATFLIHRASGEELWNGITFPLIER